MRFASSMYTFMQIARAGAATKLALPFVPDFFVSAPCAAEIPCSSSGGLLAREVPLVAVRHVHSQGILPHIAIRLEFDICFLRLGVLLLFCRCC